MKTPYLELSYVQVGWAALLMIVNGVISLALRLKLERSLLVASLRTVVQLLMIGFVLNVVFDVKRWYVVLGLLSLMTLIAGITAAQRTRRRYRGVLIDSVLSVWASSWMVAAFALLVVLRGIESWYQPQYAIPLLGMLLGNSLTGISLGLDSFTEALLSRRTQIEADLALGATRWESAIEPIRHAVTTGLIPTINSMMVVGLVSLPGMMTGQMLSGTSPIEAVKYQIVIMFLIAAATASGILLAVLFSYRRLFNANHQFVYGRIRSD